jgi:hypothetical protein
MAIALSSWWLHCRTDNWYIDNTRTTLTTHVLHWWLGYCTVLMTSALAKLLLYCPHGCYTVLLTRSTLTYCILHWPIYCCIVLMVVALSYWQGVYWPIAFYTDHSTVALSSWLLHCPIDIECSDLLYSTLTNLLLHCPPDSCTVLLTRCVLTYCILHWPICCCTVLLIVALSYWQDVYWPIVFYIDQSTVALSSWQLHCPNDVYIGLMTKVLTHCILHWSRWSYTVLMKSALSYWQMMYWPLAIYIDHTRFALMTWWLHCPIDKECTDLLYSPLTKLLLHCPHGGCTVLLTKGILTYSILHWPIHYCTVLMMLHCPTGKRCNFCGPGPPYLPTTNKPWCL